MKRHHLLALGLAGILTASVAHAELATTVGQGPSSSGNHTYYFNTSTGLRVSVTQYSSYTLYTFGATTTDNTAQHFLSYREYPNLEKSQVVRDVLMPIAAVPRPASGTSHYLSFTVTCTNPATQLSSNSYYYMSNNPGTSDNCRIVSVVSD